MKHHKIVQKSREELMSIINKDNIDVDKVRQFRLKTPMTTHQYVDFEYRRRQLKVNTYTIMKEGLKALERDEDALKAHMNLNNYTNAYLLFKFTNKWVSFKIKRRIHGGTKNFEKIKVFKIDHHPTRSLWVVVTYKDKKCKKNEFKTTFRKMNNVDSELLDEFLD